MGFSQQKNVKWSADERLDLDDLNALSSLKDKDINELLLALMEPPPNGRVFTGFTGAAGGGLSFAFDPVDSYAVASDGSVLEVPGSAPLTTSLPASSTVYIHAYVAEVDSDADNRRFLNDVVVPPEEYTLNTPTRQTKVVGLHVTSNSDATPLLSSFLTSAFLSGKTRQLVALYAMKTNGGGVIGGSIVDMRQMWMVNGNQLPAPNGGADELPFSFSGTNGDRGVKGIRSMFQGVASVIRGITGSTSRSWWAAPPATLTSLLASVNAIIANYVTTNTVQTISQLKTFSRGLVARALVDPGVTAYARSTIPGIHAEADIHAPAIEAVSGIGGAAIKAVTSSTSAAEVVTDLIALVGSNLAALPLRIYRESAPGVIDTANDSVLMRVYGRIVASASIQGSTASSAPGVQGFSTGAGPGVKAHSTGGGPGLEVGTGHALLAGGNPAANAAFSNMLTPRNVAKMVATFTLNNTVSPTVLDGFNFGSVSQLIAGGLNGMVTVNFAAPMANNTYSVLVLCENTPAFFGEVSGKTTVKFDFRPQVYTLAYQNAAAVNTTTWTCLVFGQQ